MAPKLNPQRDNNNSGGSSVSNRRAVAASKKNNSNEGDESECVTCESKATDSQPALNCEICGLWFHISCADIPGEVYDFLVNEATGQQLHWNCGACNRGYKNMKKHMDQLANRQLNIESCVGDLSLKVNKLEEVGQGLEAIRIQLGDVMTSFGDVKLIESRVSALEAAVSTPDDPDGRPRPGAGEWEALDSRIRALEEMPGTNSDIESQGQGRARAPPMGPRHDVDVLEELNDRKAREKNIIVFGVEESIEQDIEVRRQKDFDKMGKLLADCGVGGGGEMARVVRLGKPATGKLRPILVAFKNLGTKQALFKNIRSLRDKPQWHDVRIGNDMTPAEREKEKLMRDQAKTWNDKEKESTRSEGHHGGGGW